MEKYKWQILLITLSTLLIVILTKGKSIMETATEKVWDFVSTQRINSLHPAIQAKASQLINAAEKQGINLRVTSGFRSIAEQNKLYAQGRTAPGRVVTNAIGGKSYHNFGLALDVVPMVNGAADWNSPHWNRIGQIGKSIGFQWGGDFSTITDKPHFQITFGNSTSQLLAKYNAGQRTGEYVNLA